MQHPASPDDSRLDGDTLVVQLRGWLHDLANAVTVISGAAFALEAPLDDTLREELHDDLVATAEEITQLIYRGRAATAAHAQAAAPPPAPAAAPHMRSSSHTTTEHASRNELPASK